MEDVIFIQFLGTKTSFDVDILDIYVDKLFSLCINTVQYFWKTLPTTTNHYLIIGLNRIMLMFFFFTQALI